MKNLFTLCLIALTFLASTTAFAQCTPNTGGPTAPGLYPNSLPDGALNVAYSEKVDIVIPADTAIKLGTVSIPLKVCQVKIDTIIGVPAGLTYDCSEPNRTFILDLTSTSPIHRGCIIFTGTPTGKAPNDTLIVKASITVGDTSSKTSCINPLPGIDLSAYTKITYKTRLFIAGSTGLFADNTAYGLSLAPNPANNNGELRFALPTTAVAGVTVRDVLGREVFATAPVRMAAGSQTIALDYATLGNGMYFVSLLVDGRTVAARKLTIAK